MKERATRVMHTSARRVRERFCLGARASTGIYVRVYIGKCAWIKVRPGVEGEVPLCEGMIVLGEG